MPADSLVSTWLILSEMLYVGAVSLKQSGLLCGALCI